MLNEYGRTDSRLHKNKMKFMNKDDKEFLILSESLNLTPEQTHILLEYRADPAYREDQEARFIKALRKSLNITLSEILSTFKVELPVVETKEKDTTAEIKELLTTKPKSNKWGSVLTLKKK